jgi:hypothetical protein
MCLFQFNLYLNAFAMRIGTSALLLMIYNPAQGKSHALETAHHNSLRGGIRTLCTLDASLDRADIAVPFVATIGLSPGGDLCAFNAKKSVGSSSGVSL